VVRGDDDRVQGALAPRRAAPAEPAPTARAEATPVAVARTALGEPGALLTGAAVELRGILVHGADREVHPALPIDLGDLDLHVIADLNGVPDVVHPLVRHLGHADEALLDGEVLDEPAHGHAPRDRAHVDLTHLRLLRGTNGNIS